MKISSPAKIWRSVLFAHRNGAKGVQQRIARGGCWFWHISAIPTKWPKLYFYGRAVLGEGCPGVRRLARVGAPVKFWVEFNTRWSSQIISAGTFPSILRCPE